MKLFLVISAAFCAGFTVAWLLFKYTIAHYKEELYNDKLTGLKNSIFLDYSFSKYLTTGTCFVLIDIDNFKDFNTRFGYEAADEILKKFVQAISGMGQQQTEILRYKFGDEFMLVMKNTHPDQALSFLHSLNKKIEQAPLKINEQELLLYFSAGITSFRKDDIQASVISRLSHALNTAKQEKNKFVVFA